MTINPPRFPKIHSPFKRKENEDGEYVVYDEVNDGYEWVFQNDDVLAVEKLHGCFDHRSRVDTKDGAIEISKIVNNEINVPVKSYNFETESVENGTFCEGIIFIRPDAQYNAQSIELEEEELSNGMYRKYAPNMAKLRRDMYGWFEGERH